MGGRPNNAPVFRKGVGDVPWVNGLGGIGCGPDNALPGVMNGTGGAPPANGPVGGAGGGGALGGVGGGPICLCGCMPNESVLGLYGFAGLLMLPSKVPVASGLDGGAGGWPP